MSELETALPEGTEVRTYFVRERNAMLARADVGELFVDYYLHLHDQGLRHEPTADRMLKEGLVALLLHSASRPWNESIAWTMNFQHPLLNLFVASDNRLATIVGNVFTKNVKENQSNLFYSDLVRNGDTPRRSVVTFEGSQVLPAVEQYWAQSEQRPARYFRVGDEDYVFITAQPDCDLEWLAGLTSESIQNLDETETLSLLETRYYKWFCGCSEERLLPMLATAMKVDREGLFGDDASIRVTCPRCGAGYTVTREMLEKNLGA